MTPVEYPEDGPTKATLLFDLEPRWHSFGAKRPSRLSSFLTCEFDNDSIGSDEAHCLVREMGAGMAPTTSDQTQGSATAYRLADLGYAIDLEEAGRILGHDTRGRSRPRRLEAQTFEIRNPPLFVSLGERPVRVGSEETTGALSAHLYDFGVCSIRLTIVSRVLDWDGFVELGTAFDGSEDVTQLLEAELVALARRVAPAIERPGIAAVREEYVVFRLNRPVEREAPGGMSLAIGEERLVPLLLRERRRLSAEARRELLANRFSYFEDDLVVLTWDNALIVEPHTSDEDVEFVLEFANAQLLELRLYDAELDDELPQLYDRIEARRRRRPLFSRNFRPLLADVQSRVAAITEIVERADNAFKVTDDVYLARIYRAALDLFREAAWRRGVDRKLQIFRDTYVMLNGESQVARAELMEVIIVVLIAAELLLSILR